MNDEKPFLSVLIIGWVFFSLIAYGALYSLWEYWDLKIQKFEVPIWTPKGDYEIYEIGIIKIPDVNIMVYSLEDFEKQADKDKTVLIIFKEGFFSGFPEDPLLYLSETKSGLWQGFSPSEFIPEIKSASIHWKVEFKFDEKQKLLFTPSKRPLFFWLISIFSTFLVLLSGLFAIWSFKETSRRLKEKTAKAEKIEESQQG